MNILVVDTASTVCGAAVIRDGAVVAVCQQTLPRKHAASIQRMTQEVLAQAGLSPRDITLCAAVTGPGSFTGVRVGVAFAQGFAAAMGIKALALCELDVLAFAAYQGTVLGLPAQRAEPVRGQCAGQAGDAPGQCVSCAEAASDRSASCAEAVPCQPVSQAGPVPGQCPLCVWMDARHDQLFAAHYAEAKNIGQTEGKAIRVAQALEALTQSQTAAAAPGAANAAASGGANAAAPGTASASVPRAADAAVSGAANAVASDVAHTATAPRGTIYFVGDGAIKHQAAIEAALGARAIVLRAEFSVPSLYAAALLAVERAASAAPAAALKPEYLRLSQAERERLGGE